jgi:hypothetical protein
LELEEGGGKRTRHTDEEMCKIASYQYNSMWRYAFLLVCKAFWHLLCALIPTTGFESAECNDPRTDESGTHGRNNRKRPTFLRIKKQQT